MGGSRSANSCVRIPSCPFPRVSDSEATQERVKVIFMRVAVLVKKVMMVAGALGIALTGMLVWEITEVYWNKAAGPLMTAAKTRSSKENQKTHLLCMYLTLGEIGYVRYPVGDQYIER
jgi:hypothetical protein